MSPTTPTTPTEQLIDDAMKHWLSGDLASAESLLLEAAKTGNGLAAHNLGTLYVVGGPGIADRAKSQYWFEVALESGFEKTIATDPTWFRHAF
jgi:TPR repeat protein